MAETVSCPECGGSGVCPRCGGTGGGDSAVAQCRRCRGTGDCVRCDGEGTVDAEPAPADDPEERKPNEGP